MARLVADLIDSDSELSNGLFATLTGSPLRTYDFILSDGRFYPYRQGTWGTRKDAPGAVVTPTGGYALSSISSRDRIVGDSGSLGGTAMPTPEGLVVVQMLPTTPTDSADLVKRTLTSRVFDFHDGTADLDYYLATYSAASSAISVTSPTNGSGFRRADMTFYTNTYAFVVVVQPDTPDLTIGKIHVPSWTIVAERTIPLPAMTATYSAQDPVIATTTNNVIVLAGETTFAFATSDLTLIASRQTANEITGPIFNLLGATMTASQGGVMTTTVGSPGAPVFTDGTLLIMDENLNIRATHHYPALIQSTPPPSLTGTILGTSDSRGSVGIAEFFQIFDPAESTGIVALDQFDLSGGSKVSSTLIASGVVNHIFAHFAIVDSGGGGNMTHRLYR